MPGHKNKKMRMGGLNNAIEKVKKMEEGGMMKQMMKNGGEFKQLMKHGGMHYGKGGKMSYNKGGTIQQFD
jgi:hypothetical protein